MPARQIHDPHRAGFLLANVCRSGTDQGRAYLQSLLKRTNKRAAETSLEQLIHCTIFPMANSGRWEVKTWIKC
jgi:hypothetical protein